MKWYIVILTLLLFNEVVHCYIDVVIIINDVIIVTEESRIVECNITKSPFWKVAITDRWHTVQDGLMFVYSGQNYYYLYTPTSCEHIRHIP